MQNQKAKFSIPKNVTYLNCAYMSPILKAVEAAGVKGMQRKRNPLTIAPEDFFNGTELLRKEYAKLIHVADPGRIVVIPSVSYGLASVAKNAKIGRGEKIIVAAEQFPSNYYPWQRVAADNQAKIQVVHAPEVLQDRGKIWNERILEAIDTNTKMVALGHVHWADGTCFDLERIRKRTRDVGSLLIIDGTQSVGALPFDVRKFQPDALVCGGYKWLMGPYSIGLAYYGEYFDDGVPVEENWMNRNKSEDFTGLVIYQEDYQRSMLRYEVGEHSNFILVPMMIAALRQINQWKPESIQKYCRSVSAKAIDQLRHKGFWIEDEKYRGHHLFGVRFPKEVPPAAMKEKMKKNKVAVSFRGDSMRVAPHVYNTASDFEKLIRVLT